MGSVRAVQRRVADTIEACAATANEAVVLANDCLDRTKLHDQQIGGLNTFVGALACDVSKNHDELSTRATQHSMRVFALEKRFKTRWAFFWWLVTGKASEL